MSTLANKSVLILGGLGGLGAEIIRHLVPRGLQRLAVIDVAGDPKTALGDTVKDVDFVYHESCVTNKETLLKAMTESSRQLNGLDIVINSAGIFNEQTPEKMIAINYGGTVNSTLIGIDLLRKDKGGRGGIIMNLASMAGIRTGFVLPIYAGTKHAVVGFTRSLRNPLFFDRTGISFITICPGLTDTPIIRNHKEKYTFPEMWTDVMKMVPAMPVQEPKYVGECVVRALEDGKNGSVWACDDGKIHKVSIPEYPNLPTK